MNTNQPAVYDTLTRTLHWLTVIGFVGILTTIALWTVYEDAEWAGSLFGLHKSFGFLTLLLIVFRIIWAAANRTGRPQSDSKAAAVGSPYLIPVDACRSCYRHDPTIRQRTRSSESIRNRADARFA